MKMLSNTSFGGLAMSLHGSAHITEDIDIGYARNPEKSDALARALRGMNARLRGVPADLPFVIDAQTFRNTQNLTLATDIAPFYLLGYIAGAEDFEELYQTSYLVDVNGIAVHIASLDALISMKSAANHSKDQGHLLELEAVKRLMQSS